MADVADLPEINWILPGVLAAPSVALRTGATKAGKTLFTLALLKAATTGQPFLGYTIPMMRAWYLTEMTDYVLKAQLGIIDWTPPRKHLSGGLQERARLFPDESASPGGCAAMGLRIRR